MEDEELIETADSTPPPPHLHHHHHHQHQHHHQRQYESMRHQNLQPQSMYDGNHHVTYRINSPAQSQSTFLAQLHQHLHHHPQPHLYYQDASQGHQQHQPPPLLSLQQQQRSAISASQHTPRGSLLHSMAQRIHPGVISCTTSYQLHNDDEEASIDVNAAKSHDDPYHGHQAYHQAHHLYPQHLQSNRSATGQQQRHPHADWISSAVSDESCSSAMISSSNSISSSSNNSSGNNVQSNAMIPAPADGGALLKSVDCGGKHPIVEPLTLSTTTPVATATSDIERDSDGHSVPLPKSIPSQFFANPSSSTPAIQQQQLQQQHPPLPLPTQFLASSNNKSMPDENSSSTIIPIGVFMHSRIAIILDIDDLPTATSECICTSIVSCEEVGLNANKCVSLQLFALWANSPFLDLQLRPHQKPYDVHRIWWRLLEKYCSFNEDHFLAVSELQLYNALQPRFYVQRNVFYPLPLEEKIKEPTVLEMLYEEARANIIAGRYPCDVSHCIVLGAIQARLELGPYDDKTHTMQFFRRVRAKYLPNWVLLYHANDGNNNSTGSGPGPDGNTWKWWWSWLLPTSSKTSLEVRLLEQFRRIPSTATNRKLIRKYLEFCWKLPYYGAAFFHAQIQQPIRSRWLYLVPPRDLSVLIAVSTKGVHIIDKCNCMVLLGLKYNELKWEYVNPSSSSSSSTSSSSSSPDETKNHNSIPCILLQFWVEENGSRLSKVLQVFTKQAELVNNLLTELGNQFVQSFEMTSGKRCQQNAILLSEQRSSEGCSSYKGATQTYLSNKLDKLSLATFDNTGRSIKKN